MRELKLSIRTGLVPSCIRTKTKDYRTIGSRVVPAQTQLKPDESLIVLMAPTRLTPLSSNVVVEVIRDQIVSAAFHISLKVGVLESYSF